MINAGNKFTELIIGNVMKDNIVLRKSFAFAVRIVDLYKSLCAEKKEYVLSKQILKSGTSVGAAIREGAYAESKADFKHKMGIAQKEINETIYWLELLNETDFLVKQQFDSFHTDAVEILKLLTSIIKSTKSNMPVNI